MNPRLYVGNRKGYKNYSGLLNAYAKSAALQSQFKLVCFGGGRFSNAEQEHRARLGLAKGQVLCFEGQDPVLASLYKNASAFVYPSMYEGFGMPPLEAMSFGCPVVCSNRAAIPEIVGDAGEYFDPHDGGEMIEAILRVTTSRPYADELRSKGNLQISKYSWHKCASETFNIYKTLLQQGST